MNEWFQLSKEEVPVSYTHLDVYKRQALSEYLTSKFGKGFSETNLRSFRKFYLTYKEQIEQIPFKNAANAELAIQQKASAEFKLSWSHYQVLMRISDKKIRKFYEIEAFQGQWSVPQLKRQYSSCLLYTSRCV